MAIPLELGIGNLIAEFLTNTLILFRPFQSARTIAASAFQSFANGIHHFLIFIEFNSHGLHILSPAIIRILGSKVKKSPDAKHQGMVLNTEFH